MSLVNVETGELVEQPTYGEVKASIASAKASLEAAAEQIVWQIEHHAWRVLGYADWNEMREAEYGGAAFMVPRAERPELVARMRRSGLTQQEIADTAGVTHTTVQRDLNAQMCNDEPQSEPPTITNARGQQRPSSYAPRPTPASPPAPTVDEAVAEFPDLAHYADDPARVRSLAGDLRRYRESGELDERLTTLRRSIEIDQAKRDGTYTPPPMPAAARTCPACNGRGVIKE